MIGNKIQFTRNIKKIPALFLIIADPLNKKAAELVALCSQLY